MNILAKIFLVSALYTQFCTADKLAVARNLIAKQSAVLSQQMMSVVNPSGKAQVSAFSFGKNNLVLFHRYDPFCPNVGDPHERDWIFLCNQLFQL